MKNSILFLLLTGFVFSYTYAQEETESYPVTAFESNYLVDDQTTLVFDKKTLGFAIQHKFGPMSNGISDLWGIYGSANIRLGLDYVPVKNLQLGAGITKNKMYTDLNAKYSILQQTDDNSMPVGLAVYGVLAIDGRSDDSFETGTVVGSKGEGNTPEAITLTDRFSYFSQVMVSRKFTEWLSLQAAASFTHYNMVKWDENHDLVGVHAIAKVKISPQSSLTFNYNQPLGIESMSEQPEGKMPDYKPTMAIGWQISTYTHAFQIYISNAPGMLPMDNMMYNKSKFDADGIAFGFTITRLWAF